MNLVTTHSPAKLTVYIKRNSYRHTNLCPYFKLSGLNCQKGGDLNRSIFYEKVFSRRYLNCQLYSNKAFSTFTEFQNMVSQINITNLYIWCRSKLLFCVFSYQEFWQSSFHFETQTHTQKKGCYNKVRNQQLDTRRHRE